MNYFLKFKAYDYVSQIKNCLYCTRKRIVKVQGQYQSSTSISKVKYIVLFKCSKSIPFYLLYL